MSRISIQNFVPGIGVKEKFLKIQASIEIYIKIQIWRAKIMFRQVLNSNLSSGHQNGVFR